MTIIARDEADRIGDAIRSVGFATEVVVLDSGSSDDTVGVARGLGARVIETDWPGHVAQKNRAMREAKCDWVLSIDADERVSDALATEIQGFLAQPEAQRAAGMRMPRLSWWLGAPIRHGTWHPDRRIRLVDRRRAKWGGRNPHDLLFVDGPLVDVSACLLHDPYRDFSEHIDTIDRYSAIWAAEALRDGVVAHWWDLAFRPLLHFAKSYLLKAGFLDGLRGWCLAWLGAAYVLIKWSRMYFASKKQESGGVGVE